MRRPRRWSLKRDGVFAFFDEEGFFGGVFGVGESERVFARAALEEDREDRGLDGVGHRLVAGQAQFPGLPADAVEVDRQRPANRRLHAVEILTAVTACRL